jgi:PLP dependent protein
MSIIENYRRIRDEINNICVSSGRNPAEIKIVTVSKTFPYEIIQEAIDNGIRVFGENKVQEAKQKISKLKGDFSFHLVGHLQSNKIKEAVKIFDLIHSIDKVSTAIKIDEEARNINKIQKLLVQVNTSGEETKSGIRPDETLYLCKAVRDLKNIELLGLMTIGPFTDDRNKIRVAFKLLRDLLGDCNSMLGAAMKELSMGMSSDFAIAVEEGATMLRIGSAIFGQRDYSE